MYFDATFQKSNQQFSLNYGQVYKVAGEGENGKSAYEIAVDNGFEGSEVEWLESLKGKDGKDGYTPIKGVDYFDGKDGEDGKDGYTPVKGIDYFDGVNGKDGIDGYTPVKGKDYFDGINGKDGYTPVKGKDYFDGKDGQDGYTPQKGVDYFDGKDGKDGYTPIKGVDYFDGQDGKDGNGIKSTVMNADYTLTLTFEDGTSYTTPSIRGATGSPGKDGYTPVNGVDYFTEADKAEMVSAVIAALPVYNGEVVAV